MDYASLHACFRRSGKSAGAAALAMSVACAVWWAGCADIDSPAPQAVADGCCAVLLSIDSRSSFVALRSSTSCVHVTHVDIEASPQRIGGGAMASPS